MQLKKDTLAITLMELLVTVIIVGLLAGISVIGFQKTMNKAKYKEAINGLLAIKAAQEIFYSKHGYYLAYCPSANPPFPCTASGWSAGGDVINQYLGLDLPTAQGGFCNTTLCFLCVDNSSPSIFRCYAWQGNTAPLAPAHWTYEISRTSINTADDIPVCVQGSCL